MNKMCMQIHLYYVILSMIWKLLDDIWKFEGI